jgi:hypothetical protein
LKLTVDGEVYEYDPGRLMNVEAMHLERVTGMTIPEWSNALTKGSTLALTALVQMVWKRAGRAVPFEEVVFDLGALEMQSDEPTDEPTDEPESPTEAAPDDAA